MSKFKKGSGGSMVMPKMRPDMKASSKSPVGKAKASLKKKFAKGPCK